MSRWNVKRSTLVLLSCLVFLMLLIVVLPDVDLPDTAFHQGTAPLVVHARGTTALAIVAISAAFLLFDPSHLSLPLVEYQRLASSVDPNFRPILLRSLRR